MKHNKLIVGALALMAVMSCNTKEPLFENKVFISADSFKNEVRVAVDENIQELSKTIKVGVAQPVKEDVIVSFVSSPELLDHYRQAYYDDRAVILPNDNYNIDGFKTVIKAGKVESDKISFDFINLGANKLDYNKTYVLPVSIECTQMPVLASAQTMYFVVKKASLVNVVADMYTNYAWPDWSSFDLVSDMEECTMEAYFNFHSFNNKSKVHTIMGIEDHFLVRVGDTQLVKNQLHVAVGYRDEVGNSTYRKSITNESLLLRPDIWYHVAVTFNKGLIQIYLDGVLRAEMNVNPIATRPLPGGAGEEPVPFEKLNFKVAHSDESDGNPRCFWVGRSYDDDRSLDGMISEVRVWKRALTAEEINAENHFFKIYDPQDKEDLIAYWKFDEGTGKTIKDYSKYGHDLTADHDFVWYPVSLPLEK